MPERERKQKPAPKEREEVVEDVPASSERGDTSRRTASAWTSTMSSSNS